MLNIISRSYISKNASGPKKVVDNLIKGLKLIGYPYVVNKRLDACERLWIHDDAVALARISKLDSSIKVVVGPNLYVSPRNVPHAIDLAKAVYLHPSRWVKDFWLDFGFDRCPIEVWPTGIDTDEFKTAVDDKEYVLVYFKQRSAEELNIVENALKIKNIDYKLIDYNISYKEDEYKDLLKKARYVIWLGRQESQGIALQEALSCNVPMLVCDVSYVGQWSVDQKLKDILNKEESEYTNTTSAPYFDERCGIKIKDLSGIDGAIEKMEEQFGNFRPREYVLESLNLKKQATDFLLIYEKYFDLTVEQGRRASLNKSGDWRNNKLYFKLHLNLKNLTKRLIR